MFTYTKSHAVQHALYKSIHSILFSLFLALIAEIIAYMSVDLWRHLVTTTTSWGDFLRIYGYFLLFGGVMFTGTFNDDKPRSFQIYMGFAIVGFTFAVLLSYSPLLYISALAGLFLSNLSEELRYIIGTAMNIGPPPRAPYDYTVR